MNSIETVISNLDQEIDDLRFGCTTDNFHTGLPSKVSLITHISMKPLLKVTVVDILIDQQPIIQVETTQN